MPLRRGLTHLPKYLSPPTESEAEKAFTTHKNYLVHIRNYLGDIYGMGPFLAPSLVREIRGTKKFRSIDRRRLSNDEQQAVARALTISWTKELQLRLPGAFDPGLLPHLIPGSGPLAYYAAFHGARALFLAAGQEFDPTHASALATLGSWVKDRKLFPPPWSVYCEGGPDRALMTLGGLPPSAVLSGDVHPLKSPTPDTVWDSLFMLLRTTRDRQIEERKVIWRRRQGRKQVPRAETQGIAGRIPPTTLFSVLWRLRRRSDYEDASAFVQGIASPYQAEEYQESITALVDGSLTVLEGIVVQYAGPRLYAEAASGFLNRATGPGADALTERRKALVIPSDL
ncbi:MAG: hypothetical protein ACRDH6_03860 [Actinomycetota bacterium]